MENKIFKSGKIVDEVTIEPAQLLYGPPPYNSSNESSTAENSSSDFSMETQQEFQEHNIIKEVSPFSIIVLFILGVIAFINKRLNKKVKIIIISILTILFVYCIISFIYYNII